MSSVLSFLWRHKRKFLLSGMIIGGGYLLVRHCLQSVFSLQEMKARELIELSKKRQHFESTESTCDETIVSLIFSFHESVDRLLDTKTIVNQLKSGPPNKVELWEQLKILVFARSCLIIYGAVILNVILRVQINVIGGYLYRSATNRSDLPLSVSVQEEYLLLSRYFLNDGMQELSDLILKKVRDVVGCMRLDERIDIDELQRLLWTIQSAIETDNYDPVLFMERYIRRLGSALKETVAVTQDAEMFELIINETVDIISSGDVCSLASSLVWEGFQYTVDKLKECFEPVNKVPHDPSEGLQSSMDIVLDRTPCIVPGGIKLCTGFKPMAKIIPIVNGITKAPSSSDVNDCFMHFLVKDESLKVFGANVYEAFCE